MRGPFSSGRGGPGKALPTAAVGSLGVCPNPWRLVAAEEFDVDDIRVAADGAVFDVLLLGAAGGIERDDDGFAAGRAGVGRVVGAGRWWPPALAPLSLHVSQIKSRRGRRPDPVARPLPRSFAGPFGQAAFSALAYLVRGVGCTLR